MNPQRVKITQVKVNGAIIWQDPEIALSNLFAVTEERLKTSEYKEAKEVIKYIMEKK